MDKNISNFFSRLTNVLIIDGKFKITRDITSDGIEYYRESFIEVVDGKEKEYLWNEYFRNPNKKKAKDPDNPKTTGGKKPYAMFMLGEFKSLRKQLKDNNVKNTEEVLGFIQILTEYSEFNTNKLIHGRSKEPLQHKDLLGIFECSNNKLNKVIKILKDNDLLYYEKPKGNDKGGYFLSQKYIKRGKSKGRFIDDNQEEL